MTAGGRPVVAAARSEWTKLWSVHSSGWTAAATVVLAVGMGAVAIGTRSRAASGSDPTVASLVGLLVGQLAIGTLGVLAMSAEYGTGTIRATLAASPRRARVLAAKVVVVGAVGLVVGEVASLGAFAVGQLLLVAGRAPHASLGQPGVLRAVLSGGLYLAVLGVLSLGLGAVVRHTAGALAALAGLLFVLPGIVAVLPTAVENAVDRFVPVNIWAVLVAARPGRLVGFGTPGTGVPTATLFGPWAGLGVLAGFAAALVVLGGVLLVRRDA